MRRLLATEIDYLFSWCYPVKFFTVLFFKDFFWHRHLNQAVDRYIQKYGRERLVLTCSKGPLPGIKPGSAAYVAYALTTRPPAHPSFIQYILREGEYCTPLPTLSHGSPESFVPCIIQPKSVNHMFALTAHDTCGVLNMQNIRWSGSDIFIAAAQFSLYIPI